MRVCVVGAGPCGLTTIKQLLDEGHEVTCFDKNDDIGGIWLRHDGDGGKMKAFDNVRLTISMRLMAYSDFPFDGGRLFFTRSQYLEYLTRYATTYGLYDSIRCKSEVVNVERKAGAWIVSVRRDGEESSERFDAIAICTGPFKTPNLSVPGLENFAGEIVHSSEYRNNERFRNKRVLVIGLAESGADIVREISEVAEACTLAIRSYTFLLPRVTQRTRTTDQGTIRAHHHEMYRRATSFRFSFNSFWGRSYAQKYLFLLFVTIYGMVATALSALRPSPPEDRGEAGINPLGELIDPAKIDVGALDNAENYQLIKTWNRRSHPDGNWSQRSIFCKNVSFIPCLVSGRVVLNDSGIRDFAGNRAVFGDSTTTEFDTVMLCTGFTSEKYSVGDLQVPDGNVRNLYKHFLHPEHGGTAAFIGLVRPFSGGIPICAEMQARYFALTCSGEKPLPADLPDLIRQDKEWEDHWTALSPRQTESTPSQILYLDTLAYEIGCLVPMWTLILNPRLLVRLWFGSFNQSCYRIVGPHNRGAAALADVMSERVENHIGVALYYSLLQFLPSSIHPRNMM